MAERVSGTNVLAVFDMMSLDFTLQNAELPLLVESLFLSCNLEHLPHFNVDVLK